MARLVNSTMTDAIMLVGGGIVGAGLALLFAPQAGRKTRREIADMGKSIGRKGDKAVRDFSRNVTDLADTVGERAAGILKDGKELTREGKRGILTAIEKGQEALGNQKRRLMHMIG